MSNLKKYKFSDLYDMSSGISTTKGQAGHGSPFVSFSTVFNNYFLPDELPDLMYTTEKEQETFSVRKDDILITRTSETVDALAMSCVAAKDYPKATYSGFIKRLRPKTTGIVYSKYLAFFLRSKYFRKVIDCNTIMTLRASFNEDMFSFLYLYLSEYEEQVRIGDLLYKIEQKMQLNTKINDNLEQQIRLLYEYWFVQFNFPDSKGNPYRLFNGKMHYNDDLKALIPDEWYCKQILELASIDNESLNPSNFGTQLMEHYSIPAFDETHCPRFERANTIESNKYIVNNKAILVSKLNPQFKRIWDPFCETQNAICSTEFISYVPHKEERSFLYAVLDSDAFYIHSVQRATSSTGSRKRIQPEVSASFKFAYPSNESIIDAFCDLCTPILKKKKDLLKENQDLRALKDWLLPFIMNEQFSILD